MTDIENTVLDIIAVKAKVNRAGLSRASTMTDMDVDSLDVVEIFFEIEEVFDISLPFNANETGKAESARFASAGDVIDLVTAEVARNGGRQRA